MKRAALPLTIALACTYAATFGLLCTLRYTGFSYGDFDLAIFDQAMWNTLHGRFMDSSIRHVMLFGDHLAPILILLLPIYAVFQSPLTLLWAQTLMLAAGAIPLFLIARREIGPGLALLVAGLYLLYPPLAYANLFEFHTETFATAFLLAMFCAWRFDRFAAFVAFMLLALMCKEDVSLTVAAFGAIVSVGLAWRARSIRAPGIVRWGLLPAVLGIAWFVLALQVVIPRFAGSSVVYGSLYADIGGSLGGILRNLVTRPLHVITYALTASPGGPDKKAYLLQLLAPVGFVPLLSPATLVMALPALLQNLLASYPPAQTIYFHYTSSITPVVFLSTVLGLRRLLSWRPMVRAPYVPAALLLATGIASSAWLGPHGGLPGRFAEAKPDDRDRLRAALVAQVPPSAGVTTTFELLSHLSHRPRLESFHYTYYGYEKVSRRPYQLPADVTWALIDLRDPITFGDFQTDSGATNLRNFLAERRWGAIQQIDDLLLLRSGSDPPPLLADTSVTVQPAHPVGAQITGSALLAGIDGKVVTSNQGPLLDIELFYVGPGSAAMDFREAFSVTGPGGETIARALRSPCGGVLAPREWPAGRRVGSPFSLLLPAGLKPGRYSLRLGYVPAHGDEPLPVSIAGTTAHDEQGRLILWEFSLPPGP